MDPDMVEPVCPPILGLNPTNQGQDTSQGLEHHPMRRKWQFGQPDVMLAFLFRGDLKFVALCHP